MEIETAVVKPDLSSADIEARPKFYNSDVYGLQVKKKGNKRIDSSSHSTPLLAGNPYLSAKGESETEKLQSDLCGRPEIDMRMYENVPLEEYGKALLRGMGWKDGESIGKGKQKYDLF